MDKEPQESSIAASFFAKRHQSFAISDKSLACDEIGCTWRGCRHHDHFWDPELTSRQGVVSYQRLVDESQLGGGSARSFGGGCACCQMLRDLVENICGCTLASYKSCVQQVHACIELWIWTYGGDGREFDLQARWVCGGKYLDFRRQRGLLGANSPLEFMRIVSPSSSSSLLTPEPDGQTHRDDICSNVDLPRCRSWLNDCNRNHNGCARSEEPPSLPSRLLLATKGKVVLQETAKLPTSVVPYIALSYCWGGKDPAKTLRSNFQVRVKGISIAALPRTYRETIYLARQLGINHIWIDALCIVQDDNEDWQRESSRMAEIYSGAYIVFVAAAASNVEGGLDPSVDFHEWRHLTEHQVKAGSMWVRYKSHNLGVCDLLPISTRAWAYQERQLANRCLMFGESEVAWECMQGCRCQCCAAQTVVPRQQPHLLPSVLPGTTGRRFASSQEAYEFWSSAVYKFSDMQLTRPTDRLPAISAIASVIQAETGDQYLAGFWRRGLLIQLTWRPYDLGSMDPPYDVYVAPSWSWASLPSNVSIPVAGQPEEACAEAAEILHVHCEPVNICSPLSAVHQGILTLRGLCVWVNVSRWPSAAPHDKLSIISNKFDFDVMLALDNCLQAGDPIQDPSPKRPSETHAMQRTTVEKREEPDPPVKLLYLTGDDFLMLLPSRHESDKHVRVGQFSLYLDLVNRDEANKINVRQQLFRAASWELVVVI